MSAGLVMALSAGYFGIGLGWGTYLGQQGHGPGTAMSAVLIWPLMLGLGEPGEERPASEVRARGPHHGEIVRTFRSVRETLDEPELRGVDWGSALHGLEEGLYAADRRIAFVDRLLSRASTGTAVEQLQSAREVAVTELRAVLDEVDQLQLQLGLVALEGETSSLRSRLAELELRARALAEVGSVGGAV